MRTVGEAYVQQWTVWVMMMMIIKIKKPELGAALVHFDI
jgi:hypothetical protein